MGVCDSSNKLRYNFLISSIKQEMTKIDSEKSNCENRKRKQNSLIDSKRNIILEKIKKDDDYKINNEVNEYYNLLNENFEINDNITSFNTNKGDLNSLLKEIDLDSKKDNRKQNPEMIKEKLNKIKKSTDEIVSNKNKMIIDVNSENKVNIINFCNLKNMVMSEIEDVNRRKEKFIKKFNSINNNLFTYPSSLTNSFNDILNSFKNNYLINFELSLKNINNQIKEKIRNILNDKINFSQACEEYEKLKKNFDEEVSEQNEIEKNLLERKKKYIINALIKYREKEYSLDIKDIKSFVNQITPVKNDIDEEIKKFKNEIISVDKIENEINALNCFISFEIKKKEENLEILIQYRTDLNNCKNILDEKSSQLNELIIEMNEIENSSINFKNEFEYYKTKNRITNLRKKLEKEINNLNNNISNKNILFSNIKIDIENIGSNSIKESYVIIKDNLKNNKYNEDQVYFKFINKEEKSLIKIFYDNRKIIENLFLNNNKEFSSIIPYINKGIINQILLNEETDMFCKKKLIQEIEEIIKDEEKFKIDNLSILLVGRKGVGKTTLINYLLDLNEDENKKDFSDFKVYTSIKTKYLKLIEVKGIGYDDDSTPENTINKIKRYINNLANDNNQNYNSIIHCIWFCISGSVTRLEAQEKLVFRSLKELYKDNIMPIIFVFTADIDESNTLDMEKKMREIDKIDNRIIRVIAKDIPLTNKIIKKAFGKEELIKTTLIKCTEALQSDMMKIMMQQISNNIVKKLVDENVNLVNEIKNETYKDFVEKYKNYYNEGDFIQNIEDIFFNYLIKFYNSNGITKKSKKLFFQSDFITSIKKMYSSYKINVQKNIESIIDNKAKELINMQANLEKEFGNMDIFNRRNYAEFKSTSEIFLKKNYYFLFQNYIINFLVNPSNTHFNIFLSTISKEFQSKIEEVGNLNNKNEDCIEIREYIEYCYKIKLNSFFKNNILLNVDDNIPSLIINNIKLRPIISYKDKNKEDTSIITLKHSDSLVFNKNKNMNYYSINEEIIEDWFILKENNWKFLDEELSLKLINFVKEINYQVKSIIFDNNDLTFNYLQNEIKKILINLIYENIANYFNEIFSYYNNNFICQKNDIDGLQYNNYSTKNKKEVNKNKIKKNSNITFLNKANDNLHSGSAYNKINIPLILYEFKDIEEIMRNENIDPFYEEIIHINLNESAKNQNIIKLENITTILTGRSGVGKSSLVNSLLKEKLSKTGVYDVTTMITKSYVGKKIPFLRIYDTRGYELNKEYSPEIIKNDILENIKFANGSDEINSFINCIWFCVNGCTLDNSEIAALEELKNNKYNIPLIVVFTNAQKQADVDKMKEIIEKLFSENLFIYVLGEKTKDIDSFGLDELLNMTINKIKFTENNDIFNLVKNKYKIIEKNNINERLVNTEKNIINKIVKEFIYEYNTVLNENDFEKYIYKLILKIILSFSDKKKENPNTMKLVENILIKNNIRDYINFYNEKIDQYINTISNNKYLEFLDIQVKVEYLKNKSIESKNKRNKEDFQNLINIFLRDNFGYIAQKYLIYSLIKDSFENFSEQIGTIISEKINNILECEKIIADYKNIYLKIFGEFESYVDTFRNKNNKIYN